MGHPLHTKSAQFQAVREAQDPFFSLFPHRFDYIWAEYPEPSASVQWKTESRHPLSDRLIQQAAYLYGVRFGAETKYCLLDIDRGSLYHPERDPFAISRIAAALEPIGLVSYVACTSSYSGGLHLYFPFEQPQSSWKLAIAVATLLENAGFKPKPGQLEVFPDPKPYNVYGKPNLFNGHRLPLQVGSYLINEEFQPIWSSRDYFVQQWNSAQARNDIDQALIRSILKLSKRHRYAVSTQAEKFINDLNAEIEAGWTDYGQTNYLLGRITMREYIFRHILSGGQPLKGSDLVNAIVDIAQSLPGYSEYCRHRHEIKQRACEWAQCIEKSHYFHYGDAAGKFKAKVEIVQPTDLELKAAIANAPDWNQQQSESARNRIRSAIADLLEKGTLPSTATPRFRALLSYGIGGSTLYRHRDLWHPQFLSTPGSQNSEPVENPPHPPTSKLKPEKDCCEAASFSECHPSLFPGSGRNPLPGQPSEDREGIENEPGRNFAQDQTMLNGGTAMFQTKEYVQQVLFEMQANRFAHQKAVQMKYEQQQELKRSVAQQRRIALMQQFLDSNDPILIAEALEWQSSFDASLSSSGKGTYELKGEFSQIVK